MATVKPRSILYQIKSNLCFGDKHFCGRPVDIAYPFFPLMYYFDFVYIYIPVEWMVPFMVLKTPSNLNPVPEYVGDFFDFVIMFSWLWLLCIIIIALLH